MHNTTKHRFGVIIGISLAGLIFYLSVLTSYIPTIEINHFDKVNHLIAYGSLTWWWLQLYDKSKHADIVLATICFGIVIEFLQPITGRQFDILDMFANASGALFAWFLTFKKRGK